MVFRSVFLILLALVAASCSSLRPVPRSEPASMAQGGSSLGLSSPAQQPATSPSSFMALPGAAEKSDAPPVPLSTPKEIQEFSAGGAGPYLIGPGDTLLLKSLSKNYSDERLKVAPDGTISVTSNGGLRVASSDLVTAERDINLALARQFDNYEIKLVLETAVNRKVVVLGDVAVPGVVLMDGDMTVLEAIARAGGMAMTMAGLNPSPDRLRLECRIIRSNGKSVWLDLGRTLFQNDTKQNLLLRNNDIIYVYKHE